jgi:hypothetical protein
MLKFTDEQRVIYQFDSALQMATWSAETPRTWKQAASRATGRDHDWDLSAGYEGAVRLASEGWEDGVGKVSALINSIPTGQRAERTYSVGGDYADVARAISGDPFNMVRRGNAHKPRQTMTICVNVCCSAGTSARRMANFAAAMVSIIDRLENRGVRIELIGCAVSRLRGKRGCVVWTIKQAGDPLDLSAVAFGLGHPAAFRRLAFGVWERMPAAMEDYGYGNVVPMVPDDVLNLNPDALCIDGLQTGSTGTGAGTLQDAVRQAEQQINAAAIRATGEPIAELEAL